MQPNDVFLSGLRQRLEAILHTTETALAPLAESALQRRPSPERWSALQCLEHLNRYHAFYNPEIERALQSPNAATPPPFRSGWFGRKAIEAVSAHNPRPARTFARMNPSQSQVPLEALERFLGYQRALLRFVQAAQTHDLNQKSVRVEFFKLLRLRLGDALEFMVAHSERHLAQALRATRGE